MYHQTNMYYKVIFLLIVLLFILPCSSQNMQKLDGTTYDANTGEPLPYVNVMVVNKQFGTTSDSNGRFLLENKQLKYTDTLYFSHVGFISKRIQVNEILGGDIKLQPRNILLDEVNVYDVKKNNSSKIVELNKFKKRKTSLVYSKEPFDNKGGLWVPYREMEPSIETMYFQNIYKNDEYVQLKEVNISLKSFKEKSKFRLRLFQASNDKKPGREISLKTSIYEATNQNSVVNINLSDENIYLSNNGIFIGIEYLLIEDNLTIITNDNESKEAKLYSPFLKYTRVKENFDIYIFSNAKWQKIRKKAPNYTDPNDTDTFSYRPAISIKIAS